MWLGLLVMALGIAACASTSQPQAGVGTVAAQTPAPASTSSPPPLPPPSGPSTEVVGVSPNPVLTGTGNVPGAQDYLIGPQDLLKIEVFGIENLNRTVRVNSRGQISFPLIGLIQASGKTSEELAADIATRLAEKYLQNPQVTIFIEEFTSQRVTVVGAVKSPGIYPIKGRMTLLQAVSSAGGPSDVANINSVSILRPELDGTRKKMGYDLEAIRNGEFTDPEIRGEDVVQVDTAAVKGTAKEIMQWVFPFLFIAP